MKQIIFLFSLFALFFAISNVSFADDFYYNNAPQQNMYNGYTVMSLPPPPPMNEVPFYVRDDYDDYLEDYYKCILGHKYKGFTCRYWRKYAEKHGFYQKAMHTKNRHTKMQEKPHRVNNINNSAVNNSSVNNVVQDSTEIPTPYTPQH